MRDAAMTDAAGRLDGRVVVVTGGNGGGDHLVVDGGYTDF